MRILKTTDFLVKVDNRISKTGDTFISFFIKYSFYKPNQDIKVSFIKGMKIKTIEELERKVILQDFEEWLKGNVVLNEKSRKQYLSQIHKFLSIYREINLDNFRKFLLLKKDSHSDRVVYIRKFVIKRFLESINKREWIEDLKPLMKGLKPQDRLNERYIKFEHFKDFLEYLKNRGDTKLYTALMVLWDTGMRVSPIINLKVRDVKNDDSGYYITAVEKGGKLRNRYLDEHTSEMLVELNKDKDIEEYVFREKVGDEWETWQQCYSRLWILLRISSLRYLGFGISFHWTRTSRAKELYKKYRDILKVKQFLGHKRTETTERYINPDEISSADIINDEKGKWD